MANITNLEFQQKINELIQQQNKLLEESEKNNKSNLNILRSMVDAINRINYKSAVQQAEEFSDVQKEAIENARNLGSSSAAAQEKIIRGMKDATTGTTEFESALTKTSGTMVKLGFVATSALDGFISGLKLTGGLVGNVMSITSGLIGRTIDLGKSILSIPFKMLTGLINMSEGGGDNALAQALEDIRKEFGQLKETAGAAIISIARSMKGELANTGLSTYRVFGNLAERLKTIMEYAKAMGPLFENLAPQIIRNAEAFGAYNKGLGLTEEGIKAVSTRAYALGQDVTEVQRQLANYSLQLGRSFGLSAKMISRDVGTMMADFKNFGGISIKQMTQLAVYTRKLGVELKAILGVVDRFDNFEDAATGAAQLSQAFGLNLDAIQLLKAQDPAERIDMLRKSFFAAGRSIENMTRQERRLLAQQTGLDDSALDLTFSLKNQAMSYADVQRKGAQAERRQLSQAEAMQKLAGAIERLVKSGSSGHGGFVDRFLQGFKVGIKRSTEFRHLMRNLRIDLRSTFYEGIKVGRDFVRFFPGVKNVFGGLADIFNPTRWRGMLRSVGGTFREFFRDMTNNPQMALPRLLERLKTGFLDWFSGNSMAGKRVLSGFKSFFKAIFTQVKPLLKIGVEWITKGIKTITDILIKGPGNVDLKSGGFLGKAWVAMSKFATEIGLPALWNSLKGLFEVLFQKGGSFVLEHWPAVLSALFAPSIIGTISRAFGASLATSLFTSFFDSLKSGTFMKQGQGLISDTLRKLTGGVQKAQQAGGGAAALMGGRGAGGNLGAQAVGLSGDVSSAVDRTRPNPASIGKLLLLTAIITVGLIGLMYGMIELAKAIETNHVSPQSIKSAAIAVGATAASMVGMSLSIKLLGEMNINAGMMGKILQGLLVIGVVGAAMAFGALGLVYLFKGVKTSDMAKTALIMGSMGVFFLAAAAVTLIAAGVGAIAASGYGLAFIAAGVATIAAVVAGMVVGSMAIMKAIDGFRPSPGFMEKTKAFSMIIQAVGSFAANIGRIIEATSPGITGFIHMAFFGSNPQEEMRKTLGKVQEIIGAIGGQVINIINAVKGVISQIGAGGEADLKAGELIGTLLGGVASLATALTGPAQLMQEPDLFQAFFHNASVKGNIGALSEFIIHVSFQVRQLLQKVVGIIRELAPISITDSQKRTIEAIGPIIGSVAAFAKAMIPSPEMMKELNKSASFSGALEAITRFMGGAARQMIDSGLFSTIRDILQQITQSISANVRELSPRQLLGFTKGVESITAIVGMLSSVKGTEVPLGSEIDHKFTAIGAALAQLQIKTLHLADQMTASTGMLPLAARLHTGVPVIRQMVAEVNEIARQLSHIDPIRIDTGLRRLANNIGLGSSDAFTINHRNFDVNISFNVKIDAQDMERVLIDRPNTRFATNGRTLG